MQKKSFVIILTDIVISHILVQIFEFHFHSKKPRKFMMMWFLLGGVPNKPTPLHPACTTKQDLGLAR